MTQPVHRRVIVDCVEPSPRSERGLTGETCKTESKTDSHQAFKLVCKLDRPTPTDAEPLTALRQLVKFQLVDYEALQRAEMILSHGTFQDDGTRVSSFKFMTKQGHLRPSPSNGLEGFIYVVTGKGESLDSLDLTYHIRRQDFFNYAEAILKNIPEAQTAYEVVRLIRGSNASPTEKHEQLLNFVEIYTDILRESVRGFDSAQWIKTAQVYQIFPRTDNYQDRLQAAGFPTETLTGKFFRDISTDHLRRFVLDAGFDTIWVTGTFPIGTKGAKGERGGSPYSISDHSAINPDLGTAEDFKAFVNKAHAVGLKVLVDWVPNHTSLDSTWLMDHPEEFMHLPALPGQPTPQGHFEHRDQRTGKNYWIAHPYYEDGAGKHYYVDVAQLDHTQMMVREKQIEICTYVLGEYQVDGFRIDMADHLTKDRYVQQWGEYLEAQGRPIPSAMPDFLHEVLSVVKMDFPHCGFAGESHGAWDGLAFVDVDAIVGGPGAGQEKSWYDALLSGDPNRIQEAIRSRIFHLAQLGGAGMLACISNHDEPRPEQRFGDRWHLAAALTFLMPGGVLHYGSHEARPRDAANPSGDFFDDPGADWTNGDKGRQQFFADIFRCSRQLSQLSLDQVQPLHPSDQDRWVGYIRSGSDRSDSRLAQLILANPNNYEIEVNINEAGIKVSGMKIPPFGFVNQAVHLGQRSANKVPVRARAQLSQPM